MKTVHALTPVRITAPAEEPISLAEAKAHLRVDHSDEDTLIGALVSAAVAHLDGWTGILGRCMVTQTWRQDSRDFPDDGILRLPFPDVQSVTVEYTDADGAVQTLSSALYELTNDVLSPAVTLGYNQQWPSVDDVQNAVRVTLVCGYGAASAVPAALKAAMLLHIGTLYEHRQTLSDRVQPNMAYEALIAPYRRVL